MRALAALLAPVAALAVVVPAPKAAYQQSLMLPRKGSNVPGSFNLIFVAENGHDIATAEASICNQIADNFEAASYAGRCHADVGNAVRSARGLALQHTPSYATAVTELETRLGEDGYLSREFDGPTIWSKPYRAAFLQRLIATHPVSAPLTFCEVGFGAGHSSLLVLTSRPDASVFSFDTGLHRYTIPAHDYLDERFPDRLLMFLGDSAVTMNHVPTYYPGSSCDIVYVDGSVTAAGARADLLGFASLVSDEHVVVLANGSPHTGSGAAWRDLVGEGVVAWEGTVLEAADRTEGDQLLFGRYTPAAVATARAERKATAPAGA